MTELRPEQGGETPVETLERLAKLARIRIPEEWKVPLAAEFEQVLAYIAQLDELTLSPESAVVPLNHNAFREDANPNETGACTEKIVQAFPAKSGNALMVKKILSHD